MTDKAPGKATILVVDDDPTMRLMMGASLEHAGFITEEVDRGSRALKVFERLQPDLVLLDVVMPGMDGFATCKEIRKLPGGRLTPILMVTGLDDVESIHQAFDAGATDFITKPINWVILGYRVRYILRSSSALNALEKSQQQLAKVQSLARLAHWELNLSTRKLHCAPEVWPLLGICSPADSPTLKDLFSVVLPQDRIQIKQGLRRAIQGKSSFNTYVRILPKDGCKKRIMFFQGDVSYDENRRSEFLLGTLQDVTLQKKTEEKIRFLAFYDSLTGLANRHLFSDRLRQAISQAQRTKTHVAILFLDLDRFKRINDTLGHHVGDLLLKKVAHRIQHCIRDTDTVCRLENPNTYMLFSRLGGDEFTIMISGAERVEDVTKLAQRILNALAEPMKLLDHHLTITTSIGISLYPHDGKNAEALLKNADTAMYSAKEAGRNLFKYYTNAMNASAMETFELENDIHKAIEQEQFVLYYQPKLDLKTKRMTGAEGLIRWIHPEKGFIPPGQFIPLAEETGLLIPISNWVLNAVCKQVIQWEHTHTLDRFSVAVNLSGDQMSMPKTIDMIEKVLQKYEIDPKRLELELTEGTIMRNEKEVLQTLFQLKSMGLRITIDDFGTGYSSLSYLHSFPIDGLKIDKSFIQKIHTDPTADTIVKTIIAMAKTLGIKVIAEGVETLEQFNFLQEFECDQVQGYLFSKPLPARSFEKYLISPLINPQGKESFHSPLLKS